MKVEGLVIEVQGFGKALARTRQQLLHLIQRLCSIGVESSSSASFRCSGFVVEE